jgi:hypothetical protein
MNKRASETVAAMIRGRLTQIESNVVLRSDFKDLGIERQISRGLQQLQREGRLVKIGYGVYAKAYRPPIAPRYVLIEGGTDVALRQALTRLKVQWQPGTAEQAYNSGKSTQVPVRNVVKLNSRFRRKIGYLKRKLLFEERTNAR